MDTTDKLKPQNIYAIPGDPSSTLLARGTTCCDGHHQTIAGAMLSSKEWSRWYKHAEKNMLFDVNETQEIGDMSDEHWNAFIDFIKTTK